ncbi:hypothetical protein CSHISOI_09952, partial [Colletotrichum shisoi]
SYITGGGVKEQAANIYVERLSQQGYGVRRLCRAAVDYVQSLDSVDPGAIVVVGICAGGGYGIAAATTDHRIKAVAAVSLVNVGDSARQGGLNTLNQSDVFDAIDDARQRLQGTAVGGNATMLSYVPEPGHGCALRWTTSRPFSTGIWAVRMPFLT